MCSLRPLVIASASCESHSDPRNANGAMSAPALTPVTTSYWGRSSRWPSPISAPAPKAPAAPPPERARKRTTPSFDAFFSPCRAASDLASTVARSTLRKRTVPGNPTGAAEPKRVGGLHVLLSASGAGPPPAPPLPVCVFSISDNRSRFAPGCRRDACGRRCC